MGIEEYVKQKREEADSYHRTVQAIIAFDSAIRYDDNAGDYLLNSFFFPGRKLTKIYDDEREKVLAS